jgi:iron complex outermembrane receptor protein
MEHFRSLFHLRHCFLRLLSCKKVLLFSAIFICKTISSQVCNYSLYGKIIDIDDGEKLSYATIAELNQNKFCVSDAEGNFLLDSLCPGQLKLKVKHLDCTDTIINILLTGSKSITIKLPHSAVKLNSVEVYGEAKQVKFTAANNTISGRELSALKGGSLSDITGNISGVTSLNTGSSISKPMIHGLQGYRILILNNGLRLEAQQWGSEHAPEIDPFLAKRVTIVKGAGSLRYGSDGIGGVILVEPDELPDSSKITGEIFMGGNTNGRGGVTSGILEGGVKGIDGFAWRLQGTIKKYGNLNTPDYFLSTTAQEENNFSYAIGYHKKKWGTEFFYSQFNMNIGIFAGAHIGNLTDLNNAFNGLVSYDTSSFTYTIGRPYQKISHELLKYNFHIHTGKRSRLNINYGYQYNLRKEYDKDVSMNDSVAQLNLPDLDFRIETHFAEGVWDHDNIRKFRGSFGINYMYQENVYLGRYFIPNFISRNIGFFGTERYVHNKFEAELGFRFDKKQIDTYLWENNVVINPEFNFQNWSAQGGVIIKIDSNRNVLFNSAITWRSPGVNELFANGLHHGAAAVEKGDKNLGSERGWNNSITYLKKNKFFTVELTAYANYLKNFIYQEPGNLPILTIKGAFPVFYYKQTDALIAGSDLEGRFRLNRSLNMVVKAMFLYGEDLSKKIPLVYMPSNRIKSELNYQFKNYQKMSNSTLSVSCNYVARQHRAPPKLDYKEPPNAYILFEMKYSTDFQIGKQNATLILGVNNLLNTRYRDYLDRFRYYCDAPGRNFYLKLTIPINKN